MLFVSHVCSCHPADSHVFEKHARNSGGFMVMLCVSFSVLWCDKWAWWLYSAEGQSHPAKDTKLASFPVSEEWLLKSSRRGRKTGLVQKPQ